MTKRTYNWLPDPRHKFNLHGSPVMEEVPLDAEPLPNRVDLRGGLPPVYDQGQIGSCTGQALAALFAFQLFDQGLKLFAPSRLFIYWNERNIEGTVSTDAGAVIADGVKVLNTLGVCDETVWPYDVPMWDDKPSDAAFAVALKSKASEIAPLVGTVYQVCRALASGNPVVCGIPIFSSFETPDVAETGVVPMPNSADKYMGGHAILICGYYTDSKGYLWLMCRNSWGEKWGDKGYFSLPYEYLEQGASDFWTVRKVVSA